MKNLGFECKRIISFILISYDGMNNAELVILFAILHNWKLLSIIAGLANGRILDMHGS